MGSASKIIARVLLAGMLYNYRHYNVQLVIQHV